MQILAKRGDDTYLVSADPVPEGELNPVVRLVSTSKGHSYIVEAQSAIKQGYWEEPGAVSAKEMKEIERYYGNVAYDAIRDVAPQFEGKELQPESAKFRVNNKEGKTVGVVTFGGVPALEITSRDERLLTTVTKAMTSPVEVVDDDGGTIYAVIGDFLYQDAVKQLMKNQGFEVVPY